MEENETYKTITIQNHSSKNVTIFNDMTKSSKNIYNCSVFCFKILQTFKKQIFTELYNRIYILHNKNKLNSFPKVSQKDENEDEKEDVHGKKGVNDYSSYNKLFYEVFNSYYKLYSDHHKLFITNNNLIYTRVKEILKDTVLTSKNIESNTENIKKLLQNDSFIKFNNENKRFVFDSVIENIIRNFYNKSYFSTENALINHKEFPINNSDLIEEVKNKNYYYVDYFKNIMKNKISQDFNIKHNCERTLFQYLVFNYYIGDNKEKLPSDIIIHIINKFYDNVVSYYSLVKKKMKPSPPKYLKEDERFGLYYFCRSFKIEDNRLRLTVGKYIAENYSQITKEAQISQIKKKGKNTRFWYNSENIIKKEKNKKENDKNKYILVEKGKKVNKKHLQDKYYLHFSLPKIVRNKNIPLIQVIPEYNNFKIVISYYDGNKKEKKKNKINNKTEQKITDKNKLNLHKFKPQECVSIDLGVKNLMTIYDPNGKQIIIKGNELTTINHYFNWKLDKLKSQLSNEKKNKIENEDTKNKYYAILRNRHNLINAKINKIVDVFFNRYKNKKLVVVGYNDNWKTKVNLGKKNNREFYEVPYSKLLFRLKCKMERNKIKFVKVEESYTSKCDSLKLEDLGRRETYSGKRIERGLFKSGTGKVINADLNGAINILRKAISLKEIKGEELFNPKIIKCNLSP